MIDSARSAFQFIFASNGILGGLLFAKEKPNADEGQTDDFQRGFGRKPPKYLAKQQEQSDAHACVEGHARPVFFEYLSVGFHAHVVSISFFPKEKSCQKCPKRERERGKLFDEPRKCEPHHDARNGQKGQPKGYF
jgi:hypothetical protein